MSEKKWEHLNLDDPRRRDARIVICFRGVRMVISRDRLLELLEREADYLDAVLPMDGSQPIGDQPDAPGDERAPAERPGASRREAAGDGTPGERTEKPATERPTAPVTAEEAVNHASLSNRIKRIFEYSRASRQLRPIHAGLLEDLLARFDWRFPEHPNSKIEFHLTEIQHWAGVGADLQLRIRTFLERYTRESPRLAGPR